jgi:hypothetical protein
MTNFVKTEKNRADWDASKQDSAIIARDATVMFVRGVIIST